MNDVKLLDNVPQPVLTFFFPTREEMKKPRGWYNKQQDQKIEGKLKEMIQIRQW